MKPTEMPDGALPTFHLNRTSLLPNMIQTIDSMECPSCETQFPLDPERIPQQGLHVLCSRCWRVFPVAGAEGALPEVEEAWRSWKVDSDVTEVAPKEAVEAGPMVQTPLEPDTTAGVEAEEELEAEVEAEVEAWSPFDDFGTQGAAPATGAQPDGAAASAKETPAPVAREIPSAPPEGEPVVDAGVASGGASTQGTPVNPFARRDPHDRARRLARVLASDIVSYYGQRYTRALEAGTLKEEFREEVQKSWSEYVDQVGLEMAESTPYFQEALNQVLAKGEQLF